MDKAKIGARWILGLIFLVFGLNGFLHFIPMMPMNEGMTAYLMGLMGTGYFFPVLKIVEICAGLMLLTNFWAVFGLLLLCPVVVHIFLAHMLLDMGGLPMALVISLLTLFLGWSHFDQYKSLFSKFDD